MITKSFWQKRLGGDPNVIGRSITLDGMPHTIVGVLPNAADAMVWSESYRGSLDDEAVSASGILLRTHDARDRVSAGNWPNEAGDHGRTGARRVAVARAGLPRNYPNKIDSTASTSVKTLPQDVTENIRAGFATLCCGLLCVADRVQQRCESAASPLQRPASRDRAANGDRRIAQQYRAAVRLGKFAGESSFAGARSARSWPGGLCRSSRKWRRIFFRLRETQPAVSRFRCSVSRLHCLMLTGLLMGDLSGASGLPRGFDWRFEGRRPRNERKRSAAAFPQNSRRCASRAFSDVVRRRGVAHHEFYSVDASRTSGSNRIICGPGAITLCRQRNIQTDRRVSVLPSKSLAALRDTPGI